MPGQRGNPREFVGLRMYRDAIDWVDRRALEEELTLVRPDADGELEVGPNRSEMIRIALAFAAAKMPRGWRPKGWEPSS